MAGRFLERSTPIPITSLGQDYSHVAFKSSGVEALCTVAIHFPKYLVGIVWVSDYWMANGINCCKFFEWALLHKA